MLDVRSVYEVQFEFKEPQATSFDSLSRVLEVANTLESVVISVYCRKSVSKVQAQKMCGQYGCEALTLRSIIKSLRFRQRLRWVADRFRCFARLFVDENITCLNFACVIV